MATAADGKPFDRRRPLVSGLRLAESRRIQGAARLASVANATTATTWPSLAQGGEGGH
ncbi:MAG: hypothetical protein ACOX1P_27930 [Thermoguttaceae bacterium]